jgi:hypothetical protein
VITFVFLTCSPARKEKLLWNEGNSDQHNHFYAYSVLSIFFAVSRQLIGKIEFCFPEKQHRMANTAIIVAVLTGLGISIFSEPIKEYISAITSGTKSYFYDELIIDREKEHKATHGIMQELRKQCKDTATMVRDGDAEPEYDMPEGDYTISIDDNTLHVQVQEKTISFWFYRLPGYHGDSKAQLKQLHKEIYRRHNDPTKICYIYTSKGCEWSYPTQREVTLTPVSFLTEKMSEVLADCRDFGSQAKNYKEIGQPHRRGYLLWGPPGTGKTSLVSCIANEFSMSIYQICLNHRKMSDSDLLQLIGVLPPRSLIVFDEIDKYFLSEEAIGSVTEYGLLTALDGPARLPPHSIVVMTANQRDFLSQENMSALLREGRIDETYNLTATFPVRPRNSSKTAGAGRRKQRTREICQDR